MKKMLLTLMALMAILPASASSYFSLRGDTFRAFCFSAAMAPLLIRLMPPMWTRTA